MLPCKFTKLKVIRNYLLFLFPKTHLPRFPFTPTSHNVNLSEVPGILMRTYFAGEVMFVQGSMRVSPSTTLPTYFVHGMYVRFVSACVKLNSLPTSIMKSWSKAPEIQDFKLERSLTFPTSMPPSVYGYSTAPVDWTSAMHVCTNTHA